MEISYVRRLMEVISTIDACVQHIAKIKLGGEAQTHVSWTIIAKTYHIYDLIIVKREYSHVHVRTVA